MASAGHDLPRIQTAPANLQPNQLPAPPSSIPTRNVASPLQRPVVRSPPQSYPPEALLAKISFWDRILGCFCCTDSQTPAKSNLRHPRPERTTPSSKTNSKPSPKSLPKYEPFVPSPLKPRATPPDFQQQNAQLSHASPQCLPLQSSEQTQDTAFPPSSPQRYILQVIPQQSTAEQSTQTESSSHQLHVEEEPPKRVQELIALLEQAQQEQVPPDNVSSEQVRREQVLQNQAPSHNVPRDHIPSQQEVRRDHAQPHEAQSDQVLSDQVPLDQAQSDQAQSDRAAPGEVTTGRGSLEKIQPQQEPPEHILLQEKQLEAFSIEQQTPGRPRQELLSTIPDGLEGKDAREHQPLEPESLAKDTSGPFPKESSHLLTFEDSVSDGHKVPMQDKQRESQDSDAVKKEPEEDLHEERTSDKISSDPRSGTPPQDSNLEAIREEQSRHEHLASNVVELLQL